MVSNYDMQSFRGDRPEHEGCLVQMRENNETIGARATDLGIVTTYVHAVGKNGICSDSGHIMRSTSVQ